MNVNRSRACDMATLAQRAYEWRSLYFNNCPVYRLSDCYVMVTFYGHIVAYTAFTFTC